MESKRLSSFDEASATHSPAATSGTPARSAETAPIEAAAPAPVDAAPEEPATVGTQGAADTLDAAAHTHTITSNSTTPAPVDATPEEPATVGTQGAADTLDAAAHTHTITSNPTTPAPVDATPEELATASFPPIATASVSTERAARYGKQLVSHMGHKITGSWDEEAASGYLLFDREGPVLGRFDARATESTLILELRTTPERAEHLEHVAGIHLARFGARDSLAISWERTDGSEGTTQGPLTPEEVEAHARAKKAAREAAQETGHAASGHAASGHATE